MYIYLLIIVFVKIKWNFDDSLCCK